MKSRTPQGTAIILYETDMARCKPLDEPTLSALQKHCLEKLPVDKRNEVLAGRPAAVVNLEDKLPICEYNMDNIFITDHAMKALARTLLPSIQKFYENEENRREFEEHMKKKGK